MAVCTVKSGQNGAGVDIDKLVDLMRPASLADSESEKFKFSLALAIVRSKQGVAVEAQKWKRKATELEGTAEDLRRTLRRLGDQEPADIFKRLPSLGSTEPTLLHENQDQLAARGEFVPVSPYSARVQQFLQNVSFFHRIRGQEQGDFNLSQDKLLLEERGQMLRMVVDFLTNLLSAKHISRECEAHWQEAVAFLREAAHKASSSDDSFKAFRPEVERLSIWLVKNLCEEGVRREQEASDHLCERFSCALADLSRVPSIGQTVLVLVGEQLASSARLLLKGDMLQDPAAAETYGASFSLLDVMERMTWIMSDSWTQDSATIDQTLLEKWILRHFETQSMLLQHKKARNAAMFTAYFGRVTGAILEQLNRLASDNEKANILCSSATSQLLKTAQKACLPKVLQR